MARTQPTPSKVTRSSSKLGYRSSRCTSLAHSQLGHRFEAEFGEHIPCACECIINELIGEKLENACKRMKNTSAPGAHGGGSLTYTHSRCSCFCSARTRTDIVHTQGRSSAPQRLRPISMASVYRLWASLRVRDIMHWQETWADNALSGYRPEDVLKTCDGSRPVCGSCTGILCES